MSDLITTDLLHQTAQFGNRDSNSQGLGVALRQGVAADQA